MQRLLIPGCSFIWLFPVTLVVLVVLVIAVDGEVPEDLCVIIFDYFFWFYPPVFTVLMVVLSTYGPVCY